MMSIKRVSSGGPTLAERARGVVDRLRGRRLTAFVLSGGGNLGAVQVGMLRALDECGVKPDLIVGCSVGAINGAAYAAEPDRDGVERLARIWGRLADGDPELMPSSRFTHPTVQMARKGESIHDQTRLEQLLDEELAVKTFSQLSVPFCCVATDIDMADEVWFDSGRLVPALLASAALPAVFPALSYAGRTLIDGGVLREVHTDKAVALGATDIYLLHVGHLQGRGMDVQRPFDGAMRAYWTARRFRLAEDIRQIPDSCRLHILPPGSSPVLRFDDFSLGRELAELAYEASISYLTTGMSLSPVSGPRSSDEEFDQRELAEQFAQQTDLDTFDALN
ncbi:MAG: patatin-like phospholipase family protein [Acidimicrobiia bacterium]|nr:patatin-like phospholipase family protein [Acidimicrobiia bacterium]